MAPSHRSPHFGARIWSAETGDPSHPSSPSRLRLHWLDPSERTCRYGERGQDGARLVRCDRRTTDTRLAARRLAGWKPHRRRRLTAVHHLLPDGGFTPYVFGGFSDLVVRIMDVATGKELGRAACEGNGPRNRVLTRRSLGSDGHRVRGRARVGHSGGHAALARDPESGIRQRGGQPRRSVRGHNGRSGWATRPLGRGPEGRALGQPLSSGPGAISSGHARPSTKGTWLALLNSDSLRLFDGRTAQPTGVSILTNTITWQPSISFSPDERYVISGRRDGARISEVTLGESVTPLMHHRGDLNSVAFAPDGGVW